MIRLHFSAADLRQITLAPAANATLETALSVRCLRTGPAPAAGAATGPRSRPGLERWRQEVGGSLAARAGMLLDVVPRDGFLPDFLLQPSAADFATGVDLVRQTPASQLAADVRQLGTAAGDRRRLRELAEGTPRARRTLVRDLGRYHASSIAPLWPRVHANAVADRALRAEMLLRGGVDALLTTLNPLWLWQPPTLHIPSRGTYDVQLCGRGLLLIPSYFATGALLMYRPDQSTVLVYPMHLADRRTATADALTPLLGRTRAAVLAALRAPSTTTALAERVGISLAGASQHAAVLRNAGLITTTRTGTAVLHSLCPLGRALLDGAAES